MKIPNPPALKYFHVLKIGVPPEQYFQGKVAQLFGFFPFGNHSHAGKAVSGKYGGIWIRGHGHVRFETKIASAPRQVARDFWQRTEQRFQTGKIQKDSVTASIFHSR